MYTRPGQKTQQKQKQKQTKQPLQRGRETCVQISCNYVTLIVQQKRPPNPY